MQQVSWRCVHLRFHNVSRGSSLILPLTLATCELALHTSEPYEHTKHRELCVILENVILRLILRVSGRAVVNTLESDRTLEVSQCAQARLVYSMQQADIYIYLQYAG